MGHIEQVRDRLKAVYGAAPLPDDDKLNQMICDVMVSLVAAGWRLLSPDAVTVTVNITEDFRSITFTAPAPIGRSA